MGKNAAADEAERARREEKKRQERIRQGTEAIDTTFGQFDDGFFSNLSKSFTDYARPQLDEQAGKAKEQLTYQLARSGTLDSSIRSERQADLQREYDKQLLSLEDQGRGYATEAKTNVEGARNDLVSLLQVTGDNVGAANAALSRAKTLATPPVYSPLSQLFTDFTAGLAQQAAFEKAAAYGAGPAPRYSTGLFGTAPGAVKVTGA